MGTGGHLLVFVPLLHPTKRQRVILGEHVQRLEASARIRGQPPPSVAYATDWEYVMEQRLPGQRHALMSDWRWRLGRPTDVSGAGAP